MAASESYFASQLITLISMVTAKAYEIFDCCNDIYFVANS
jgi:hypothetical protein